jgi:predicted ATPase
VAWAPTRERLVGQLMTALFNAGRQAAALKVFAQTRRVLADELGLDPSRELRAVMEQILRQDPAITPTPAAAVLEKVAGNLPSRTTSFVGRAGELARTLDLLRRARLITLVGPGGAGKTALGVEAARAAAPRFRDGVWLVRLAAVTEPQVLVHTIADALTLSMEGGTATRRPSDLLVRHLAARDVLVVLDNCEHLIEPVATLVEAVLGRCPDLRIMTTSREALAVPGEVQLVIGPLAVPHPGTPPARVASFPAARLFLDRAHERTPDLVLDDDELAAVGVISRRLDGIPLALELAAARLASLTPRELAARVVDRFAVLTSGSRTADARQQTLRNTVDWSHELLTSPERVLFRRLAVFRGGWTLPAAEDVVSTPDLPEGAVLDLLERLLRQSLVVADKSAGHTRYRMLETLREYAADKLRQAGEDNRVADVHAAHFLRMGEEAESGLRGPSQSGWLQRLDREHANLRAALRRFQGPGGNTDGALRLAGSLGLYWHMGRHLEGREALRLVMASPGGSPAARGRALQAVALVERPRACMVHPSEQCAAAAYDSLMIFESVGDRARAAFSRVLLAVEGVAASSPVDAATLLADADGEFGAAGDGWGQAVVAFVRMEILAKQGVEAGTRVAAGAAIDMVRVLGDGWGLSAVLYHFGWALSRFGRYAEAVPVLEEAIEVAGTAGVDNTIQWATADLGLALLALGRVQEASACFARAGVASERVGDDAGKILAGYGEAVLAVREGRHDVARPLFARSCEGFERLGVSLATGMALTGLATCDEHAGNHAAARASFQRLLALARTAGEVGLMATALEGLARAALADDEPERTAELLGRAASLRETYDRPASAPERSAAEAAGRTSRSALGEPSYTQATRRGAAVGLTDGG